MGPSTGRWMFAVRSSLLVLGAVTYLVVAMIIKMTSNPEPRTPEPSTIAAMEQVTASGGRAKAIVRDGGARNDRWRDPS